MPNQGYNSWASIAPELVAYGMKAASGWKYFDFVKESIKADAALNVRKSLRGSQERSTFLGPKKVGGDITIEMLYEGILYFLKHACGGYSYAADTPVVGARTHTFVLTDPLPSYGLSMEVCRANVPSGKVSVYTGGKVDSLEFSCSTGDIMQMVASMLFQDELTNQTPSKTPTLSDYPGDYPVLWRHSGNLTLCGDSNVPFDTFRTKIANGLPGDRFLMQNTLRAPIRNSMIVVDGEITSEFESLSLYTKFLAHTPGSAFLQFTSDSIITGSTARAIMFSLPEIVLSGGAPNVDGAGIVPQTLPFRARYNGSSSPVTIVVINGETTLS